MLDTGTEIITEAAAILVHLALTHPERRLLPAAPIGVARAVEWLNWLSSILAWAVGQNVRPDRLNDEVEAHIGIRRKGRDNILALYRQIDERLAAHSWALAEGYSVVDPTLLIFYKWGDLMSLDMSRYAHWTAHAGAMMERPAVRRTIDAEGISIAA